MGVSFYNNPDEMDSSGQNTVRNSNDMFSKVSDIETRVNRLAELWDSDSSRALLASVTNVKKDLQGFGEMFEELGNTVSNIAKDVADNELERAKRNDFYQG